MKYGRHFYLEVELEVNLGVTSVHGGGFGAKLIKYNVTKITGAVICDLGAM